MADRCGRSGKVIPQISHEWSERGRRAGHGVRVLGRRVAFNERALFGPRQGTNAPFFGAAKHLRHARHMDRTQLSRFIEVARLHGERARAAFEAGDLDTAEQQDRLVLQAIENAHAIIVAVREKPRSVPRS